MKTTKQNMQTSPARFVSGMTKSACDQPVLRPLQHIAYWLYTLPAQLGAIWRGENLIAVKNVYGDFFARPFTQTLSQTNPARNCQLQEWIRSSPEGTVFDIGAGVGLVTNTALQHGSASAVFAFEPNPSSYPLLLKHISANNLNAEAVHAAVSKSAGTLEMPPNTVHTKSSSTCGGSGVRVPTVSLDQFIDNNDLEAEKIGVIKIDSHGHELPALEGMQKTLHNLPEGARLVVHISTMGDAKEKTTAFIKWCGFQHKETSGKYHLFTKEQQLD